MRLVYKITNDRLPELFARIAEEMPLYLPMRGEINDGIAGVNLTRWSGDFASVDLQILKTILSPKGFFFPASEELYKAVLKDNTYEITPQPLTDRPFALFGVRACDAAAIKILDGVFIGEATDEFYKARRDASCIITLACESLAATCFCGMFGINPAEPGGDVSTWLKDNYLYWQPQTEKGERLTKKLGVFMETVEVVKTDVEVHLYSNEINVNDPSGGMPNPFTTLKKVPDILSLFISPAWDELHRTCVACGTCTFLCPTCHCYDIADCRRNWDACLYPGFTQMAHGNPRPTKKERFRQRYMHKLAYHPQRHGVVACVGCGRCVAQCPVNMNIVKVAKVL
ncbi:MAG: 4Fe-4S dicluster domain-containing protein [Defluviitaleaceae bacterium]|nr:4Fe-4S dicluster domain-containing protein [Defluviitaleaceae bacterium]